MNVYRRVVNSFSGLNVIMSGGIIISCSSLQLFQLITVWQKAGGIIFSRGIICSSTDANGDDDDDHDDTTHHHCCFSTQHSCICYLLHMSLQV